MFSPDFIPRDPHTLWYTPSASAPALQNQDRSEQIHNQRHGGNQRQRNELLERTPLARIAADELYLNRRRLNIQNFGSSWLKPPGIPKTLHQMLEEKREQEEHAETIRREQLAQELEQAEQEGMPSIGPGEAGAEVDLDGVMDDVQLDGALDLDEEIPDADDEDYGFPDDEDENEEDEGDEGDSEASDENHSLQRERQVDLMTARMRMTDDAFREALVRGEPNGSDLYGDEEEMEEEEEGHIFDEADILQEDDLHMDADLDDEVPEAESEGYEHTDSEAELSSDQQDDVSDEDGEGGHDNHDRNDGEDDDDDDDKDYDIGFAPRTAPLGPPLSPTLQARTSLSDVSHLLHHDESSFMDDSPVQGRRNR